MSKYKCPECGMTNIDCGKDGFKTPREIELETLVIELENRLKMLDEEAVTYQLTEKEYEEYKKLKVSSKQLEEENETLKSLNKHLTENGLFSQRHFKEENEKLIFLWVELVRSFLNGEYVFNPTRKAGFRICLQ